MRKLQIKIAKLRMKKVSNISPENQRVNAYNEALWDVIALIEKEGETEKGIEEGIMKKWEVLKERLDITVEALYDLEKENIK